jgi:hypothetical protein
MANGIVNRDYYGAMERGRVDADQAVRRKQVNALGQIDVQQAQRYNALSQDPNATAEQFARVGQPGVANSLTNIGNNNRQNQQLDAQRLFLAAEYGIRSQQPKAFLQQNFPELVALNPNFANETDDQIKAGLQELRGRFGPTAGFVPAPEAVQYEQQEGPRGSLLQRDPRTGELKQIVGPDNADMFPGRFMPLTPQEIAASGLPAGTAAQRDVATGKIDILTKRDNTGALSQKDQTAAKQKLVTVVLAKQQLARIRDRFAKIKGSMSAGAFGQGRVPTEGGRSFDAAVDQMRSTLTALTRTPGVGAMSDYETKLDQAKFPARTNYESVTEEQIQAIDDQLSLLENGYKGLLSGNAPEQAAPQQQPQQAQGPVQVRTREEAMRLPPGTQFVTPDGRVKVRP